MRLHHLHVQHGWFAGCSNFAGNQRLLGVGDSRKRLQLAFGSSFGQMFASSPPSA
jgi:hypothetical protein